MTYVNGLEATTEIELQRYKTGSHFAERLALPLE